MTFIGQVVRNDKINHFNFEKVGTCQLVSKFWLGVDSGICCTNHCHNSQGTEKKNIQTPLNLFLNINYILIFCGSSTTTALNYKRRGHLVWIQVMLGLFMVYEINYVEINYFDIIFYWLFGKINLEIIDFTVLSWDNLSWIYYSILWQV